MNPKIWGPPAWKYLESVVEAYPTNPDQIEKNIVTDVMIHMSKSIPCYSCQYHFKEYLSQHPVATQSKKTMAKWLNDFHNSVNERLNKTKDDKRNTYMIMISIITIIIMCLITYKALEK